VPVNFNIDSKPPSQEVIDLEIKSISAEIKHLTARDTLITFILITLTSLVAGSVVFWTTGDYYYAGGAVTFFPVLGTVLSLIGVTKSSGFRSVDIKLGELKNSLAALNPVSNQDLKDIEKLCSTHKIVDGYYSRLKEEARTAVNGELAMFWEFDTSTMAKTAKGRDYLEKARNSVKS